MGLGSSSYRFLALTDRNHTITRNLMKLSSDKLSLTREMQACSTEYNSSISTKTLKWSNNSGTSYMDLSYSNLMTPSEMNQQQPYLITDSSGRVVVASNYQKYAKMISPEGVPGGDYQSNRTEILSELIGVPTSDINRTEGLSAQAAEHKAKIAEMEVRAAELEDKCTVDKKQNDFIALFGTVPNVYWDGRSHDAKDCKEASDWKIGGPGVDSAKAGLQAIMDAICNNMKNYLTDSQMEKFKEACSGVVEEYTGIIKNNMYKKDDSRATVELSSEHNQFSVNCFAMFNGILSRYRANTSEDVDYRKSDRSQDVYYYCIIDKTKPEYAEYEQLKKNIAAEKETYNSLVDSNNQVLTVEQERLIDYYDAIFTAIAEKGWVYNAQVADTNYLNEMFQNGSYALTSMQKSLYAETKADGSTNFQYEYTTDIAENNNHVYKVNDDSVHKEATAEYEYKKSIISAKEARIDTRMQDLKTEQSSIQQMLEGLQSVMNDNIERNFSIMS